jgi:hypothetical protein
MKRTSRNPCLDLQHHPAWALARYHSCDLTSLLPEPKALSGRMPARRASEGWETLSFNRTQRYETFHAQVPASLLVLIATLADLYTPSHQGLQNLHMHNLDLHVASHTPSLCRMSSVGTIRSPSTCSSAITYQTTSESWPITLLPVTAEFIRPRRTGDAAAVR